MIEKFSITKLTRSKSEVMEDFVTEEIPFTINLNGKETVTMLCSPADLKELAAGFLFTSGLVKNKNEIKNIHIDSQKWLCSIELNKKLDSDLVFKRLYTSGCGKGTIFYSLVDLMYKTKLISDLKIKAETIVKLMPDFYKKSQTFLKTGGTHASALASGEKIIIFKEDIGRHNAIDKVIGQALLENIDLKNTVLITSGRISSEVIFKARKAAIAIVISKSAPTNQAVKHARGMDITVVGFARGAGMNIYSAERRIEK
jgi:FdhD protein